MSTREFFDSIGSPSRIVAPMVDHSGLAYRMLTRKYGAELVYTQMFSAHCFVESAEYRKSNFQTCPEDRPLVVQFCGNDPQMLLRAAKYVENDCDAVDINLGCPQGIARKGHYGAFLMEELELLASIVSTLSKGLRIPVTCKTRIYKDFDRSVRLLDTLVNAGASLITVHGRTREEKKQMIRACDWAMLKRIKAHFAERGVPVICNGGVATMNDFHRCLSVTGADGVMVS
ncbi:DUS1, partial [Symbiodinium microadriaticum]